MRKMLYDNKRNVIAKNLYLFRQKRGLTQEQLAARLQTMNVNIDQQMISKIELNKRIV